MQFSVDVGDLTRSEQKILEFINTNRDTFLYLSIGQLAQALDMSDATVSRFARHVGCRDYKSLKALVPFFLFPLPFPQRNTESGQGFERKKPHSGRLFPVHVRLRFFP